MSLLVLLSLSSLSAAQDWGYQANNGPDSWANVNVNCGGQRQSPVAIHTNETQYQASLTAFDFACFEDVPPNAHWVMVNTGVMLKVDLAGGEYVIREGGLDGDYRAVQLHWHWGSSDGVGGEHIIDGVSSPMELHMVTYAMKYGSMKDARKHEDGLANLAFRYQLGKLDHPGYSQIVKLVNNVTYPGDHIALRPINLHSLLPKNLNQFFRYQGSLTTPPCTENVVWTVFNDPVDISHRQMRAIRTALRSSMPNVLKQRHLSNNFRPAQDLNERVVYSSDPTHGPTFTLSSPVSITIAAMIGITIVLLLLWR